MSGRAGPGTGGASRSLLVASLQALLVTFLWSTSFVLIKIGLRDLPALSFAGFRYALAFLALLPLWVRRGGPRSIRGLPARAWLRLTLLGILYYTITQGAQFLALAYLPAVTLSLLLSSSALIVAILSSALLRESPAPAQWLGIGLYTVGVLVYFWPLRSLGGTTIGILVALAAVVANALSSILGRSVNRSPSSDALTVTVLSMGIGGVVLLASGLVTQGLPRLEARHWVLLAYLAVVSGAAAFTLWNHTLRTLTATQSSLLNNTMLFQIGVLAWAFLGEAMSVLNIVGAVVASLGVVLSQLSAASSPGAPPRRIDSARGDR